ncbi:hypothetical protein MK139_08565 [bacterium]|nr:hypothetical protein [bacterium]
MRFSDQLADIATTDPFYQTQTLFDKIVAAWQQMPHVKAGRLSLRMGEHLYRMRTWPHDHTTPTARILPRRPPVDIISHICDVDSPASRVILLFDEDIPIPALPGDFYTITHRHHDYRTGRLKVRQPDSPPRIIIALEYPEDHPVYRTHSSSANPFPQEPCPIIDLFLTSGFPGTDTNGKPLVRDVIDQLEETCAWMIDFGIHLRYTCAERLRKLLTHPNRDFIYDPLFDPSTLTEQHRAYLQALADTDYSTNSELGNHIGTHRQTLSVSRLEFTDKYGPDHLRRALQAGMLKKPT